MNRILLPVFLTALLGGCMYAETPDGRFAALDIDLPTHSTTTVNKTVTVNAPPGTVVNISETAPDLRLLSFRQPATPHRRPTK